MSVNESYLNSQMLSDIAAMIEPTFAEDEAWSGTVLEAVTAVQTERDTLRAENERLKTAVRALLEWDARRGYPVPYAVRDPLRAALSEPAQ